MTNQIYTAHNAPETMYENYIYIYVHYQHVWTCTCNLTGIELGKISLSVFLVDYDELRRNIW